MSKPGILTSCLVLASIGACSPGGVTIGDGPDDPIGPDAALPSNGRVVEGLAALYLFDEGVGDTVYDQSGAVPALDLAIGAGSVVWTETGLSFQGPSLVQSEGPATRLVTDCQAANAITVEAWVRPANTTQSGPARILDVSDGPAMTNFALGQSETSADAALRTTATELDGNPAIESLAGAFTGQDVHLVYKRSGLADEGELWINGRRSVSETVAGSLLNWNTTYSLSLGNEPGGNRPWMGEMYLAAIYCRALGDTEIARNYDEGY